MKNGERHGILYPSTMDGGGGVEYITRIDINIYSCVTKDITTDEVIITNERVMHITEHHPNDYERYCSYMRMALEQPDYILEDGPNTALILKEVSEEGLRFRLILRLKTSKDDSRYKNSILTFWKTNGQKWRQNVKNRKILYKRPES